jgi:hypothetical protein
VVDPYRVMRTEIDGSAEKLLSRSCMLAHAGQYHRNPLYTPIRKVETKVNAPGSSVRQGWSGIVRRATSSVRSRGRERDYGNAPFILKSYPLNFFRDPKKKRKMVLQYSRTGLDSRTFEVLTHLLNLQKELQPGVMSTKRSFLVHFGTPPKSQSLRIGKCPESRPKIKIPKLAMLFEFWCHKNLSSLDE